MFPLEHNYIKRTCAPVRFYMEVGAHVHMHTCVQGRISCPGLVCAVRTHTHTHLHKCTFTYLYALVNYTHTDLSVLVYAGVVVAHADA